MNPEKNLILIKNEIKTTEVERIRYNAETQKYNVRFSNGRTYAYRYDNVERICDPLRFNVSKFEVYDNKKMLELEKLYLFTGKSDKYWYAVFKDESAHTYRFSELKIVEACAASETSKNIMEYFRRIAEYVGLKDENGENILLKKYSGLPEFTLKRVISLYINPGKYRIKTKNDNTLIFPFGCNGSQFKAVKNAMENRISVIEGPPGTGKTQTILNIIANIVVQGKTIEMVSYNNSATENVLEKLSKEKYGMDFIVAHLGSFDNKQSFIEAQTGTYPDISAWEQKEFNKAEWLGKIKEESDKLDDIFKINERIALIKQELNELHTEKKYHKDIEVIIYPDNPFKRKKGVSSENILDIWHYLENIAENEKRLSFFKKIQLAYIYGLYDWNFYKSNIADIILEFQNLYYKQRELELNRELNELNEALKATDAKELLDTFTEDSLSYFKHYLFKKYGGKKERKVFTDDELYFSGSAVQHEYPVILSTTYSSTTTLGRNLMYDYVIMDEASQVDIATGALALACAKNAVIVGDRKQLPNIVKTADKKELDKIFKEYDIDVAYNYTENSFLKSLCRVIPDVPNTLLKEHYRCHPKIINFCNQKFYNNELVIMTEDNNEDSVITAVRTVKGNHERDHMNMREVEVICNEVLPQLGENEDIGIIAPYRNQVNTIKSIIKNKKIDVNTVHKFQGRENDTIIISTVDNVVTCFSDDPYLLNVAVSRAKKKLCLVTSGNEQPKDSNINDLMKYIEYNNFEIKDSKLHSVFDYLYKMYSESRMEYLKKTKRISEYDSENLMYQLINDTLDEYGHSEIGVLCHQPLNTLLKDLTLLSEEEAGYALNPATHIDFLLYNRVTKEPILAIEVDGWSFHKEGTRQAERDKMKNGILEKYELPLIRFATNGSREREQLIKKLNELFA